MLMARIAKVLPALLGLAAVGFSGCGRKPITLYGSGSTFIKPLMDKWIDVYTQQNKDVEISYQGTGSAAGIRALTEHIVDFACTDVCLDRPANTGNELESDGPMVHVPLVLGALVPAYNLPGMDRPLRFTGAVLADIFLGKITKWNNPALQTLNPEVVLPDLDISVVHRSDGSGSTFVFTEYLSKVSDEWRTKIGAHAALKWPVGVGEPGNPGVAGFIRRTPGSIGYPELSYALLRQEEITFGAVCNKAGKFIRADLHSVRAAAENSLADIPNDLRFSLTDAEGADSYPICGGTWALLSVDRSGKADAAAIDFLRWATHQGQNYTESMHYASLPPTLVRRIEDNLHNLPQQ